MISNIRLYQTISEIINFIKGRINLGIKKGARPSVIRACHHFCMSFCNKISGEKKGIKRIINSVVFFFWRESYCKVILSGIYFVEILATGWPDIYWSLSWKFRKTAAEKPESLCLMEMEPKGTNKYKHNDSN